MQLTPKKALKYFLQALLIVGVIVALGFLSFTGMLALCGIVACAITSFALTAMIEGEVYAQNVLRGVEKLLKGKWFDNKYLKHAIYIRELNKLLKEQENIDASKFLQEYSARLKAFEALQAEKEKLGLLYFASDKFKQKFEMTEKLLQEEQKYFIDLMEGNVHKDDAISSDAIAQIVEQKRFVEQGSKNEAKNLKDKISKEFKQKHAISPWCLAASVFAGVGMGLVFFSVAPESIIATAAFFGVALSASAFPVGVTVAIVALSAMAAVGYTVLVYNTLTDMLQNDAVQKWIEGIKKFFKPGDEGVTTEFVAKRIFGALGVALLVALCTFATITTAGTWWYAAKAGAIFILPQLERLAAWLSTPLVIVMGIGQLGFNLYNSLKSVKIAQSFIKFIRHLNVELIKKWFDESTLKKDYFDREILIQFVNPFRFIALIIALPFKVLVFLGHVISSAVMGDRFEGIPVEACVVPAGVNEITTDFRYFFQKPHGESQKPKEIKMDLISEEHKLDKKEKAHAHTHEGHDHSHTDIPGKVLLVALSPIYFLSALWDFGCSLSTLEEFTYEAMAEAGEKSLIKAFFGMEAWDVLSNSDKALSSTVEEENMKKELSAHKIFKRLADADKSKGLTENEKDFFTQVEKDLRHSDVVYTAVFEKAEKNGPSEPAKAFLAKVKLS